MTHTHPLDGDGVTAEFFKILMKQSHDNAELKFLIPDTILFYSSASVWYYYDKRTSQIKKRNARELDKAVIFEYMCRDVCKGHKGVGWSHARSTGIVSTFTSTKNGTTSCPEDVLFMGEAELKEFLFDHRSERYGFLQKFIPPKSAHNEVVQCVWSPEMTFALRRTNRIRINDRSLDKYAKAVTFEGPTHYCNESLCNPGIVAVLQAACQSFVEHFHAVESRFAVSRCCLYFKSDPDDQLYLLYLSSLRIMEPEWVIKTTVTTNNPLCLHIHEAPPAPDLPPPGGSKKGDGGRSPTKGDHMSKGQFRTPSQATMKHASREQLLRLFKSNRRKITKQIEDIRLRNREQSMALEYSRKSALREGTSTSIASGGGECGGPGRSFMTTASGNEQLANTLGSMLPKAMKKMQHLPHDQDKRRAGHMRTEALQRAHVLDVIVRSHAEAAATDIKFYRTFLLPLEEVTYAMGEWTRTPMKGRREHHFSLPHDLDRFLTQRFPLVFRDVNAVKGPDGPDGLPSYRIAPDRAPPVGMAQAMYNTVHRCMDDREKDPAVVTSVLGQLLATDALRHRHNDLVHAVAHREKERERREERVMARRRSNTGLTNTGFTRDRTGSISMGDLSSATLTITTTAPGE